MHKTRKSIDQQQMESKKTILIVGMKRSGSCVLFNIVRLICGKLGTVTVSGRHNYEPNDSDYEILKFHEYDLDWHMKSKLILTSERNHEDVYNSLIRTGQDSDHITYVITHFLKWNMYADYCMGYQEMTRRPMKVIKRVAELLRYEGNLDEILTELQAIKPPKKGQDKLTMLYSNHRK